MSSKILAGKYELLEKIGEGGMSVVYKAKHRSLNRFEAIKILKPEFIKDQKFIESFRKESQAAASLSHPNIVNVYDVGKDGNIHFIAMELVEGRTLSEVIKEEGPLPYQRVIEITKQIAAALSLAHKNNLIHRDVKPHNVLITNSGVAKITDFGIAKAINSATIVENTGSVIGSVHYFSPEQARGGYVDEKSDIYSLGIVMYEMLTGTVPFDGENAVSIALMHINSEMTPPSKLVDGIPPVLEQIVMKCTDKYQTNRYASADELIEALSKMELVGRVVGDSVMLGGTSNRVEPPKDTPILEEGYIDDDDEDDEPEDDRGKRGRKRGGGGSGGKKKKIIIGAAAAAAVIICIIAAAMAGVFSSKPVVVPDLTDQTLEAAQRMAEEVGFEVEEGEHVFDNEIAEGKISSQTPEANSTAKRGAVITVNISKGPQDGTIPDLEGMSREAAEQKLNKAGFKLGEVTTKPGERDKGEVMKQSPNSGEVIAQGTAVDIVLSDGSLQKVKVPDLLGKDIEAARQALDDAGLSVGRISYGESNDFEENEVMWQEYGGGSRVQKNASVAIKISQGKKEEPEEEEPKSVEFYIDFEKAKNDIFYMTVTISDKKGTRNVISNQMRVKNDGGEYVNLNGQGKGTVTVTFDGKQVMKKKVDFSDGSED